MSECEITAVYRYSQSDRDYPSGAADELRLAYDLARAPDIMTRAIEAGQAYFSVREVTP